MSNNAAVTSEGGEIGRAQALQARACGTPPATDMNPVLLKPQSDHGAQVVVRGRVLCSLRAKDYATLKPDLMPAVLDSFERLSKQADLVLAEGAGSPAEINLRKADLANMGFAEAADIPVALVGDIDRGGVIASIVGTALLLPTREKDRIKGFVINKFRGDIDLFSRGVEIISERTGFEPLGVVPYFLDAGQLPAEDSVAIGRLRNNARGDVIRVVVPVFSRIANFDDLDPLIAEPDVEVDFVEAGRALPGDADLVVLPGSKATLADLQFMRHQRWDQDLFAHLRRGGWVLGLCGGYQMLGRRVADPDGIEGPPNEAEGLGLLDVDCSLGGEKTLVEAAGTDRASGEPVQGYEMHVGVTSGPALARPMLDLNDRPEGAVSADGRVAGCYLHGLFAADGFRHDYLRRIRERSRSGLAYEARIESVLDGLADHLEAHLSLDRILQLARAR
jgi:adenosylcobyric acid synthase